MFSIRIRTCFAVDGACWRSSQPSSSLSNNLYIVIARARFCAHTGAWEARPHAPPTARMREGIKSLSPSAPLPLDPFLSGKVGGGSAACSKNTAAGVAALDPYPRFGPTPAASAGGGGGGCGRGHPPPAASGYAPLPPSRKICKENYWPLNDNILSLFDAAMSPLCRPTQ